MDPNRRSLSILHNEQLNNTADARSIMRLCSTLSFKSNNLVDVTSLRLHSELQSAHTRPAHSLANSTISYPATCNNRQLPSKRRLQLGIFFFPDSPSHYRLYMLNILATTPTLQTSSCFSSTNPEHTSGAPDHFYPRRFLSELYFESELALGWGDGSSSEQ